MKLLIISGLSGSGKSIALQALEDLDFYCVDNLPVGLLPDFASHMKDTVDQRSARNVAAGIDARNVADDLEVFQEILGDIKGLGIDNEIIFLEANDESLLKRFSETRRKHPLTNANMPLVEAVTAERSLLEPIAACADLHIDTSHTNVHQLRALVLERVAQKPVQSMSVLFESFGYKHGIPADADFVFDIRCLPNPHWDPRLRVYTGRDSEVITFLEQQDGVARMFEDIKSFLESWLSCFKQENRSYMTIAIGCTGGQHRSVYMVELLAGYFRKQGDDILIRHRELS